MRPHHAWSARHNSYDTQSYLLVYYIGCRFLNEQGRPELMQLALRTLEYWVDSLNPEFLEPAMADVTPRLMSALWSHLRPPPYPFGPKARFNDLHHYYL